MGIIKHFQDDDPGDGGYYSGLNNGKQEAKERLKEIKKRIFKRLDQLEGWYVFWVGKCLKPSDVKEIINEELKND